MVGTIMLLAGIMISFVFGVAFLGMGILCLIGAFMPVYGGSSNKRTAEGVGLGIIFLVLSAFFFICLGKML